MQVQRYRSALTRMAAPSTAYVTCGKSITKQAQQRINLAVAGHLYYLFTRRRQSIAKFTRSPKLSTKRWLKWVCW